MNFVSIIRRLSLNTNFVKKCANYKTITRVNLYSTATEPLPIPQGNNEPKQYPKKLHNIVDEIAKLTLLEVSELNQLLKKTLNIPDTPMMSMPMSTVAAKSEEEDVEEEVKTVQTAFTVKMTKYDESKKVPIIKEVKNVMEGFNLVQAKKFVESLPQVVKAEIGKEEAEKIKDVLEAAGAICEIS